MGGSYVDSYASEGKAFDQHPDYFEIMMDETAFNATRAFIAALGRNACPWFRSSDVLDSESNFRSSKLVSQALIDVLKGEAPCAKTLQSMDVHGMSEMYVVEVETSDEAIVS
jgi:hypothetical protein|eukprot:evm.model.NODE_14631_length_6767_cov_48.941483.1